MLLPFPEFNDFLSLILKESRDVLKSKHLGKTAKGKNRAFIQQTVLVPPVLGKETFRKQIKINKMG